jgi:hypothetical protein
LAVRSPLGAVAEGPARRSTRSPKARLAASFVENLVRGLELRQLFFLQSPRYQGFSHEKAPKIALSENLTHFM